MSQSRDAGGSLHFISDCIFCCCLPITKMRVMQLHCTVRVYIVNSCFCRVRLFVDRKTKCINIDYRRFLFISINGYSGVAQPSNDGSGVG